MKLIQRCKACKVFAAFPEEFPQGIDKPCKFCLARMNKTG